MSSERVMKGLAVTAELVGRKLSEDALRVMVYHLRQHDEERVLRAILRCQAELKTFPTVTDVLIRIEYGHPGVEEAWALCPKSEEDSAVWTEEIATAYWSAQAMLEQGDKVAARMTFKEVYERGVATAQRLGVPAKWKTTFGTDRRLREGAVVRAVAQGRLTKEEAIAAIPDLGQVIDARVMKIAASAVKQIEQKGSTSECGVGAGPVEDNGAADAAHQPDGGEPAAQQGDRGFESGPQHRADEGGRASGEDRAAQADDHRADN